MTCFSNGEVVISPQPSKLPQESTIATSLATLPGCDQNTQYDLRLDGHLPCRIGDGASAEPLSLPAATGENSCKSYDRQGCSVSHR